jgi:hypothetical protein
MTARARARRRRAGSVPPRRVDAPRRTTRCPARGDSAAAFQRQSPRRRLSRVDEFRALARPAEEYRRWSSVCASSRRVMFAEGEVSRYYHNRLSLPRAAARSLDRRPLGPALKIAPAVPYERMSGWS